MDVLWLDYSLFASLRSVYKGKVDTDASDKAGRMLLSYAVEEGHAAVVKPLLDQGKVDAGTRDGYGGTPLSRAAENGHVAVVKLLLDIGKVDIDALWAHQERTASDILDGPA